MAFAAFNVSDRDQMGCKREARVRLVSLTPIFSFPFAMRCFMKHAIIGIYPKLYWHNEIETMKREFPFALVIQ